MTKSKGFGAAGTIGASTMLSRVLGLVREQVFAYFFGAGFYTDAFQIAFRIPNLLRDLFAEGAMSAALVPVYTKVRAEGEQQGWALTNNSLNVLFVLTGGLALIGMLFADYLVGIYAPAFSATPGKHELTVQLTQIMWGFFPLVVMAAVSMAVLNARSKFLVPALAPSFFNIASIVVAFSLCPLLDKFFGVHPIVGMAWGVLLGGALQWLVQLPVLLKEGWHYRWYLKLRDPNMQKILILMCTGTFGLAATQINILVNSVLASSQGDGAVSWLNYAFRLMQFPIGVFGVAISTVALTQVSQSVVEKNDRSLNETILGGLRLVLFLTVPSAMGLVVLGAPIIAVIYERGKFDPQDTYATALALAAYAVGLTAYSGVKVLGPVFYSLGKARVAVFSSIMAVVVNVLTGLLLVRHFSFVGLAFGTSLGALVNFFILLWMLRGSTRAFAWRELVKCALVTLGAALVMGVVLVAAGLILGIQPFSVPLAGALWLHLGLLWRLSFVGLSVVLGVATYALCAKLMGLREIDIVVVAFRQRWQRMTR